MTEQDMIAAFIARKGVTRVAAGESTLTSRDMYQAVRGERSTQSKIDERHVTRDATGREYVTNGLGERIT